jgi:hypothetical protein
VLFNEKRLPLGSPCGCHDCTATLGQKSPIRQPTENEIQECICEKLKHEGSPKRLKYEQLGDGDAGGELEPDLGRSKVGLPACLYATGTTA